MSEDNSIVPISSSADFVMPKHVAAVVPFEDHETFGKLEPQQKLRVSNLLQLFTEMATSPEGLVACSDRLSVLNPGEGCSGSNLRTLYYAFKKRGWRALAKIYRGPKKIALDFEEHFRRLSDNNARSARAVMQEIRDAWANGASIPGYGTWREYHATRWPERDVPERWPLGFFPAGWGESNLYTKRSIAAQRKLKTHGYFAAKRYLPHLVRDTSQLRPLELITIDDFELDFLVRAFNPISKRWEICRAAGLLAIDVATRRKLAVAIVPRFKMSKKEQESGEQDAEGSDEKKRRISITRRDVQSLLHVVFSEHGRPREYGCTILCENGGAAITRDFELALELLLGVQVARTGLIDDKTLRNGMLQGGGKPWEKGWIESLFSLVWNYANTLPGQKGKNYIDKPGDHEALVAYAEKLFKIDGLPPEVAEKFRVPFLTIDQALDGLNAIFARIENRTDHKCRGFLQVFEYQRPDVAGLIPEGGLLALSQDEVEMCVPVPRMESPLERWNRLRPACYFDKIADFILACLLLTPKKLKLKNLRLTFVEGNEGYTFADADSPVMKLPEGTELLGYYDPAKPGLLFVSDLKGRYIGQVRRRGAIDIRDHAAISAEAGEITRMIRSLVVNPLRERHAGEDAQLALDRAHNDALVAPFLPPPKTEEPKSNGISAKLARAQAPARDAFAAGSQLAAAISQNVGEADAVAAQRASVRAQARALSAADLADFNAPETPAAPPVQPSGSDDADTLGSYL